MSAATLFQADLHSDRFVDSTSPRPGFMALVGARVDAEDLRAIALTFVATAAFVLFGAATLDTYLLAMVNRPVSLDGLLTYRLAADMLPWAFSFTFVAGAALVVGMVVALRANMDAQDQPTSGFRSSLRR